ncbi:MAG: helix-turn-helix transcriptional regulator [Syntrophomonadaceae bacterium]|jgi:transcriptional regulator with XRE-family HTH domain|nr:helix-turn-helix transcriptional regulator [Syntrophomonadaceae bacterium]
MTVFASRLALLLKQFDISNAKLSKALNVDPSLISKWINGKRVPSPNSIYISRIADYLLKYLIDEYQQSLLLELLRAEFPSLNLEMHEVRRQALMNWLRGEEDSSGNHIKSLEREDSFGIDSHIMGQTGSYELFRGREGKRQSALNFLQEVLAWPEPIELLLMSQEDIRWINEDQGFLNQWRSLLYQVIKRGHRIKIVHTVNRDISQIAAMLNNWIPMHLTGQVESFYHPRYEELALFKTLFIATGRTAILSLSTSTLSQNDSDYTLQFRDAAVLGLLEDYFRTYLSQCQPLIQAFSGQSLLQVLDIMIAAQNKPGHFYRLHNHLTSMTMPSDLFARLVELGHLNPREKESRIQLHRQWKDVFFHSLKYNPFLEIFPIQAIDLNFNDRILLYPGSEFFLLDPLQMEVLDFKEHLEHIVDILEHYDNYELFLLNAPTPLIDHRFSIAYKEDYYAMVSSDDDNSYIIETNEGNTLHAFENYFKNVYEQIPIKNRSKSWVINKIKSRIIHLDKLI